MVREHDTAVVEGWQACLLQGSNFDRKVRMQVDDTLVFAYKNDGLQLDIYRAGTSEEVVWGSHLGA
jgi:hypothetical protein